MMFLFILNNRTLIRFPKDDRSIIYYLLEDGARYMDGPVIGTSVLREILFE